MQFYKLASGARFEFCARQLTKVEMSLAQEPSGEEHIIPWDAEVSPIGEPLLLTEQEAENRGSVWNAWTIGRTI